MRMWGNRSRAVALSALMVGAALMVSSPAQARETPRTTPGTASQIKALVAASIHITSANHAVLTEVANANNDTWAVEFHIAPNTACVTATQCVYGDLTGSSTIVLYGDSHARQWLPALNAIAIAHKARLVILGQDGCPMVKVNFAGSHYMSSCSTTATESLKVIATLKPEMVILANSTYDTGFSKAKWEAGLEATFKAISPSGAQMVVLQDLTEFTLAPPVCISRYPTQIQHECSVNNPNHAMSLLTTTEQSTAKLKKVPYILTQQWFCTTTRCSPVVGNFVTHFDRGHITASYATYLTTVLSTSLQPYFKG
jgi:hypothetical protein